MCARTEKVYEQSFSAAGRRPIWPFHDLHAEDVPGEKRLDPFRKILGEIELKMRPADGVAATGPEVGSSLVSNPY